MQITVLGGRGGWPGPAQACSGYLVEHSGHTLLIDPGYATLPRLQQHTSVTAIDAVIVSHAHPDHCADLNPLLRARSLGEDPVGAVPVYAPTGAVDAVLALDPIRSLDAAVAVSSVADGEEVELGPFSVRFAELPHHVTNLGVRISTPDGVVAYTGDSGPDEAVVELGRDADVFLVESTFLDPITDSDRNHLCDVGTALRQGTAANARTLLLTHLWPTIAPEDVDPLVARAAGPVDVRIAGGGTCIRIPGVAGHGQDLTVQ